MIYNVRYRDRLGKEESSSIEAESLQDALDKADAWAYSLNVGGWMREYNWVEHDGFWLKAIVGVLSLQLFV